MTQTISTTPPARKFLGEEFELSTWESIKPFYKSNDFTLYNSDSLEVMSRLPDNCIDMVFADASVPILIVPVPVFNVKIPFVVVHMVFSFKIDFSIYLSLTIKLQLYNLPWFKTSGNDRRMCGIEKLAGTRKRGVKINN